MSNCSALHRAWYGRSVNWVSFKGVWSLLISASHAGVMTAAPVMVIATKGKDMRRWQCIFGYQE